MPLLKAASFHYCLAIFLCEKTLLDKIHLCVCLSCLPWDPTCTHCIPQKTNLPTPSCASTCWLPLVYFFLVGVDLHQTSSKLPLSLLAPKQTPLHLENLAPDRLSIAANGRRALRLRTVLVPGRSGTRFPASKRFIWAYLRSPQVHSPSAVTKRQHIH